MDCLLGTKPFGVAVSKKIVPSSVMKRGYTRNSLYCIWPTRTVLVPIRLIPATARRNCLDGYRRNRRFRSAKHAYIMGRFNHDKCSGGRRKRRERPAKGTSATSPDSSGVRPCLSIPIMSHGGITQRSAIIGARNGVVRARKDAGRAVRRVQNVMLKVRADLVRPDRAVRTVYSTVGMAHWKCLVIILNILHKAKANLLFVG